MRRRGLRLAILVLVLAAVGTVVSACASAQHGRLVGRPAYPSVAAGPADPAGGSEPGGLDDPMASLDGRTMFDLHDGVRVYAYWTPGERNVPWTVLVHGGSWRWGDAADLPYADWAAHEKSRGWAAFSIDYRLVPAVHWPAPEQDVERAISWIRAHGDYFGLAPRRGFIVGHSAGGQLASIAALSHGGFAGAVSAAGATDPYLLYRTARSHSLRRATVMLIDGRVDDHAAWAQVNAASYLGRHVMPFLVIQSIDDPEVPFAVGRLFARELATHGYPTTLHPVAGSSHGLWSASDTAAIDRWMDAVLARTTSRVTSP